jgi:hypothetical protein
MPVQYTQRNPNAFSDAYNMERSNRLQDLAFGQQQQDRQLAMQDRQYNRERIVKQDQRQANEDSVAAQEREREKILRNLPFAQSALQSGDPHGFIAAALQSPAGSLLRADGIFDEEDLNDPNLQQSLQAFIGLAGPQKPVDPGPLETVVDPVTKQPVLRSRSAAAGMQPYIKPPEKDSSVRPQLVEVLTPDGKTQKQWVYPGQSQGTPVGAPVDPTAAPKPPTETDKKNAVLLASMRNAEADIQNLIKTDPKSADTSSLGNALLGSTPMTRVFQSDQYRKYEAAGLRWAANLLYLKSGATANPDEIRSTWKQFFPQPGDGPDVKAQKEQSRQQEISAVTTNMGPRSPAQPAQSAPTATGPNGQKLILQNGQWVPINGR